MSFNESSSGRSSDPVDAERAGFEQKPLLTALVYGNISL
jgi:hypothetical protein